jgi:hypothetical protein
MVGSELMIQGLARLDFLSPQHIYGYSFSSCYYTPRIFLVIKACSQAFVFLFDIAHGGQA